ncbi:hypothetical protein PsorP6_009070 [Peronosclerospora sorghi]|uniref:Uncharacterized protein n=1 Tax=Peronosclerospora sorghi TaxID=230839 RepID=A0ACC0VYS3_9STRA|nr:hypothetical protein PsorP6_009070 [Peronosclerospora sorghi]
MTASLLRVASRSSGKEHGVSEAKAARRVGPDAEQGGSTMMATSAQCQQHSMEEKADAGAFVDALYRKVLLAVKASNAIPSEDDGFHFHAKFCPEFASRAKSAGAQAEALVRLLTKRRGTDVERENGAESSDDDEANELFDGPEPDAHITDYTDMLLDEASKHLALFMQGSSTKCLQRKQLENKPQMFEKSKKVKRDKRKDVTEKKTARGAHDKPQERFEEKIDNSHVPFVSKLREKVHALQEGAVVSVEEEEEDESASRHPYYREIRALKYAPWQVEASNEPYERVDLEEATYLWVSSEETLAKMMQSLTAADARVIAVDLEHHSYRSYMGLTCLMQISIAREDFLVDTLTLRNQLQVLNQVFCNPEKVKVLHGSDMDILWLQRDLGLYIVNLFDTGRAARLLQYPRFSLAYMLKRHCNIDADKQYQLADWRIRPLEKEMIKYARQDTRYLLFIYDRLKKELVQAGRKSQQSLLFQTLQKSSKLCLHVYEKPQPTEDEALALGEKLKSTINVRMLSDLQKHVIVALYQWRDRIARQEDESVVYVMPNHVLMKLTKHLPLRSDELFRACHPVPLLIRKNALELLQLIAAEKTKFGEQESKIEEKRTQVLDDKPARTIWNEEGEKQIAFSSSLKRIDHREYPPWKTGHRKASMTQVSTEHIVQSMALGMNVANTNDPTAPLLEKVNALVASTTFRITECERAETTATVRKVLSEVPRTSEKQDAEVKPHVPPSIAETYHLPHRSKRRKTTPLDPSMASQVKDRAEMFMQTVQDPDETKKEEEESGLKGFDYAIVSDKIQGAKFRLKHEEDAQRHGARAGYATKKQAGYNPFVAVRGTDKQATVPQRAQVTKAPHHMTKSATFK